MIFMGNVRFENTNGGLEECIKALCSNDVETDMEKSYADELALTCEKYIEAYKNYKRKC